MTVPAYSLVPSSLPLPTMSSPIDTDRRRALRAGLALLPAAAVLSACGAGPVRPDAPAQPPSPNAGPWRTSTQDGEDGVMLEGHDAVAYFTQRAAVRGNPAITSRHGGVVWRFASREHRDAFEREPVRWMPQFGGFCTNGICYAVPWGGGGGPETWRVYRGRLYVFGGQRSRDHFEMDTELNLRRAHHYWNAEIAGHAALPIRLRRLVLRVPHYRSDAELQADWDRRRGAGTLPVMPGRPQVVPEQG